MTETVPTLDRAAIFDQIAGLHRLAIEYKGKGQLVLASYGEDPDQPHPETGKPGRPLTPIVQHFEIGDVAGMVAQIERLSVQPWRNVYVPHAVFRSDLKPTAKGAEKDIVAVLGAVIDFDDADAERWRERLPGIFPDYVLETSARHFQVFYFFDHGAGVAEAKAIGKRLRDYAHTDHGSLDASHVWRIGGSLNWPKHTKIEKGRARAPQLVKVVSAWEADSRTTLAALDQALPAAPELPPAASAGGFSDASDLANGGVAGSSASPKPNASLQAELDRDIATLMQMLPERLREKITTPAQPGTRSERLFGVIKELGRRGLTASQIKRLLLAHPAGPVAKFAGRSDLDVEIARILGKLDDGREARAIQHQAVEGKPVIKLVEGKLTEIVDEAEGYLVAGDKTLYQRGDFIVTPGVVVIKTAQGEEKVPGIIPVEQFGLVERFTKLINFQQFSRTREEWETRDCPDRIANTYLKARVRRWKLRKLRMLIDRPFPRADGTICEAPGYDEASGILYEAGAKFPPVPKTPDKAAARAALDDIIETLIVHYPFVDPDLPPRQRPADAAPQPPGAEPSVSRSVALSANLTGIYRPALSTTPIHGYSSTIAGSGKSKLLDACALLSAGHPAPVFTIGETSEEQEKRLGALLLEGAAIIAIDNVTNVIDAAVLAQAVTQPLVKIRILRTSEMPLCPNVALVLITGNNLALSGDLPRRTVRALLDPATDRPEQREFPYDPVKQARKHRARLVVAALTIWRAFFRAGCPTPEGFMPTGSFEDWDLVRKILLWLGEPDPIESVNPLRGDDPALITLNAVLTQWEVTLGSEPYTTRQIIARAAYAKGDPTPDLPGIGSGGVEPAPEFREALLTACGNNGAIDTRRLGRYLGINKGRPVGGRRVVPAGLFNGNQQWRVERVASGEK